MQSSFYLVHLKTGDVFGSNDKAIAESFVQSEDYVVINTMTGEHYDANGHLVEVKQEMNPLDAKSADYDPNAGAKDPDTGGGNDTGTGR